MKVSMILMFLVLFVAACTSQDQDIEEKITLDTTLPKEYGISYSYSWSRHGDTNIHYRAVIKDEEIILFYGKKIIAQPGESKRCYQEYDKVNKKDECRCYVPDKYVVEKEKYVFREEACKKEDNMVQKSGDSLFSYINDSPIFRPDEKLYYFGPKVMNISTVVEIATTLPPMSERWSAEKYDNETRTFLTVNSCYNDVQSEGRSRLSFCFDQKNRVRKYELINHADPSKGLPQVEEEKWEVIDLPIQPIREEEILKDIIVENNE